MGILSWIIVGLISGWLAALLMRGQGYGVLGDIIVGIIGALVGGFLATALFGIEEPLNGLHFSTLFVAFLGSILMVAVLRLMGGQRSLV